MPILSAASSAVAPLWLVLPLTGIAMAIVTMHVLSVRAAGPEQLPPRRRRIRLANGVLMYILTPLLAYAMAIATPAQPRAFVLAWSLVTTIAALILMLGIAEAWLIRREHLARLEALRREFPRPDRRERRGGADAAPGEPTNE